MMAVLGISKLLKYGSTLLMIMISLILDELMVILEIFLMPYLLLMELEKLYLTMLDNNLTKILMKR
jgi:hypothetical protein